MWLQPWCVSWVPLVAKYIWTEALPPPHTDTHAHTHEERRFKEWVVGLVLGVILIPESHFPYQV